MTVRTYLFGSTLATLIGIGSWLLVINFLDPNTAGILGYILFFLSLFIAITSATGLIGYGLRRFITAQQLPAYNVRTSLRQSLLLSTFVIAILVLQLLQLYRWWLAVIFSILILSIELLFLNYDRAIRRRARAASQDS